MAEITLEQQFAEFIRMHHPELATPNRGGYQEPEDFHGRRIVPVPYQEFPKLMYSPKGEKPRVAMKKKEQERLEEQGWSTQPFKGHVFNADGTITVPAEVNIKPEDTKKAN